jgi:uncharacterized protein YecA (UPF0149 family)
MFFHHIDPYMCFMAAELAAQRPPANVMRWAAERDAAERDAGERRRIPGRNDPCLCGSGKKFKQCCLNLSN